MSEKQIQMVDLQGQYIRLQGELDAAMQDVLDSASFINGAQVQTFASRLAAYLEVPSLIPCGNGTDALQIALMALNLSPGDEVIVPAFTYVAAVEAVAILGLTPVLVDVDPETFNIDANRIEEAITPKTRAIIVVHLFGQACDMVPVMHLAESYGMFVIEDNAQSIGAVYSFPDGNTRKAGTIGHIGTTSFFPSKPLACYGDGGALMTSDAVLASRIRMIANHGQERKYHHRLIGCNSRLDTMQAAILNVKLKYLDDFTERRKRVARCYDEAFSGSDFVRIPCRSSFSTHVYHQYTVQVGAGCRDRIRQRLKEKGIPSMVYYPLPVHYQEAYRSIARIGGPLKEAERLSEVVLSLPIHTELTEDQQTYIIQSFREITGMESPSSR